MSVRFDLLQMINYILIFGVTILFMHIFYYLYKGKNRRILYRIFFIASGIPLVILYPGILMSNIMSLAAPVSAPESMLAYIQRILMYTFMLVTTLYPCLYVCCIAMTHRFYHKPKLATIISLIPLIMILPIIVLLFL